MDVFLTVAAVVFCGGCAAYCLLAVRQANKSADRAVEYAEAAEVNDASAGRNAARCAGHTGAVVAAASDIRKSAQQVRAEIGHAADVGEVVKIEVAKLESLIGRLSRERAENPPVVQIVHDEETGGAVKAEVLPEPKVVGMPFASGCLMVPSDPSVTVQISAGQPFAFAPTQVHPTIIEASE